ncbi:PhoX family protein [Variovorax terrae]|uniref:PhoX family phosphatase n=1 Tax=Variovorax terrae TaxID=2923278 RepID=A0A9X1VUD4_9BURK|nr:PhoX family phosphatase [Variovorax terrae]MCJ0763423.1 PhoX family phosphatase [Variovorax terrae]
MQTQRRFVLKAGATGLVALLGPGFPASAAGTAPVLGFTGVAASARDALTIPPEYEYSLLYKWGDPTGVVGALPAYRPDASNNAQEQAVQAGMHHDGMHFFPLNADGSRALLVMNHEYTDERLLHTDGATPWTAEKVRKSQHAMGVSVIEIALGAQGWRQVLPSRHARRIHGNTPMRLGGPAAGSSMLQTALNPAGDEVLGTFANCAMGVTPWGTYLTCEENFHGYFGGAKDADFQPDAAQRRYGTTAGGQWVDWYRFDERFDLTKHPNEANRFGWVVEIDPMDPTSTPVKRTALGRKRQESATCTLTQDGRVAVYMGDDTRFEYIYKFVSRDKVQPGGYAANRELLDHGTLYVARFDADGRGAWLELTQGRPGLGREQGFATQADVVVKARLAADAVGGTKMDRPEWITVHPHTGEVFVTLTNNSQRGEPGRPGPDAANPRERNVGGHIIRWREAGGDAAASAFGWRHFVLAGDPARPGAATQYPSPQADAFGCPDGLHFDRGGLLWIQTDMSGQAIGKGSYAQLGNNAMLCADPATGRIKRFLSGPSGCEITGCVVTPDRRTLFVNIQHPGEASDDGGGAHNSAWPDGTTPGSARPRSATVVVRRRDGGLVGT